MFYTNSTIDSHIHTDLLGTGTFQNPAIPNSAIETFYLYKNNEVLKEAQLYISPSGLANWLITSYTYDALANLQTATDPLHHETCYSYSAAYNGAYVTSETSSGTGELQRGAQRERLFRLQLRNRDHSLRDGRRGEHDLLHLRRAGAGYHGDLSPRQGAL